MSLQMVMTPEPTTPICSRCGQTTRIYGVEPHSQNEKTDIRTYVCDGCETVEVRIVPNAILN
jgi:hypothetical protein